MSTLKVIVGTFNAADVAAATADALWEAERAVHIQRALREAAFACGAAYVSTEMPYDDAVRGILGLSANGFSAATFCVGPVPRQHVLLGARLTMQGRNPTGPCFIPPDAAGPHGCSAAR